MYAEIDMHDRKIKYIVFRHTKNNKHHQKVKSKFFFIVIRKKNIAFMCLSKYYAFDHAIMQD